MNQIMDQIPLSQRENSKKNQERLLSNTLLSDTTPMPNALLDRVMPILRDTEFRVLMVVVRQTRGWQDGPHMSQRKERDWLTQSQLMGRTGRGSGAVAHAVEALVQAGLIEVQDRAGTPLKTAADRRRHLGRLYYRLGPASASVEVKAAKSKASINMRKSIPKSAHAKSHTTKETENKINKDINKRPHRNVDKSVDNSLVIRTIGWERVNYRTE